MTDQQATVLINAHACEIREVLWQVQSLADWNPAFLSITGSPTARIGEPHPIRVRGGLTGHLQYDLINLDRTEMSWQVPGLHETNHWQLHAADGHGTMVTHGLTQTGPLAMLCCAERPAGWPSCDWPDSGHGWKPAQIG